MEPERPPIVECPLTSRPAAGAVPRRGRDLGGFPRCTGPLTGLFSPPCDWVPFSRCWLNAVLAPCLPSIWLFSSCDVTRTTIGSLGLKAWQAFGYWFDFGEDWWHQINVVAIEDKAPSGKYPRVTKRIGKSPPQYADWDAGSDSA
jgi:hypothetical protein